MEFRQGKARIMDALLDHGGLQHLVDVGAEVIGNPVFVCDLAARVMAMSHATEEDRAFWDEFFPGGRMDPDNAADVGRAGIYERVFSNDTPVVGKFDFYPGRFVGARIRLRNDVVGMATLVEREPLGECDGDLLVVLCQAIVLEMTWQDMQVRSSSALLDVVTAAIEGTASGEELDLMARGDRLGLPSRSRVLVIALESGHSGVVFSFSQGLLARRFPTSPTIVRHGRLVMLLDLSRYEEVPLRDLEACLANLPLRVGVGGAFDSRGGIKESYRQARAAMVLSQRAGLPAGLANYDDWRLDDLLMQVAELTDLSHYIDPVTERMAGHDRREGTQLIKTVDAYLRCANNAQAAARLLGIHKNTMYARLERIQQLFDVDLESGETCQSLALSLRMRRVLAWRGDPVTK
jgi:hypothetical protein